MTDQPDQPDIDVQVPEEDPILDTDRTQNAADQQVLLNEIGNARMELARLKVAYYAEKAGIEITFNVKGVDGKREARLFTIQRHIDRVARNVAGLQAMYEDISSGNPIPVPESQLQAVAKP